MLKISKEAAPRISLWIAILFLSLVTICRTGSTPISLRWIQAARLQRRVTEVWLSVIFIASTWSLIISAFLVIASGSLPRGGPHSEVTARWPEERIFSNLLGVFTF